VNLSLLGNPAVPDLPAVLGNLVVPDPLVDRLNLVVPGLPVLQLLLEDLVNLLLLEDLVLPEDLGLLV
jgi:hypothetical protein